MLVIFLRKAKGNNRGAKHEFNNFVNIGTQRLNYWTETENKTFLLKNGQLFSFLFFFSFLVYWQSAHRLKYWTTAFLSLTKTFLIKKLNKKGESKR